MTAETFVKAWQARDRFVGNSDEALGWLLTIARRLVIDKYRHKKRQQPDVILEDNIHISKKNEMPEPSLLLNEQQIIVLKLLQKLPEKQHEMIVLRYLLRWPVKQIASHLDMSPNTVSVTVRRVLQTLRSSWPIDDVDMEVIV